MEWTQALGEASVIKKLFSVVAHDVSLHKIDMKNKDATIQYLTRKNKNTFPNLTISWIGWLKAPIGEKTTGSLIIEVTDPVTANRMIDGEIVTRSQMHTCILYNPKCRMKQCFNCARYGHKAQRCPNQRVCTICLENYTSTTCQNSIPKCALCQGSQSAFDKQCTHRSKEIDRIKAAQLNSPRYHQTQITSAKSPTPKSKKAVQTQQTPLSQDISIVSSSNAPSQPSGPRTQPANKRKRKITLEVFEKQETQNTANNQRGSFSTEPSDRRRSRSPERSERRNEKNKSGGREDRTPLGLVSSNSLGSRLIGQRRKSIKGKEAEEDEDMLDDIFTDAPTQ